MKHVPLVSEASTITLEFTPLEFETVLDGLRKQGSGKLEFTPLEFETDNEKPGILHARLEFTPLEFETVLESAASGITQN